MGFEYSKFQKNIFNGYFITEKGMYKYNLLNKEVPLEEVYVNSGGCDCYFEKDKIIIITGNNYSISFGNRMQIAYFKRSKLFFSINGKYLFDNKVTINLI